jgi:hypothetical protein
MIYNVQCTSVDTVKSALSSEINAYGPLLHSRKESQRKQTSEPVFVNFLRSQESIPPAFVAWRARYVK